MEQQEQLLLETVLNENNVRRRNLLPLWIKVFVWIFMIIGAIAPLCLLAGLFGANVQLALYGLETNEPLSTAGLVICLLFLFKGIIAYGLWTEKDWAINLGVIDAIVGIIVCVYVMVAPAFADNQSGSTFSFRLELVILIPYLIKLLKIKPQWLRR